MTPSALTFTMQCCLPTGTKSLRKKKAAWQSSQADSLVPLVPACVSPVKTKLINKLTLLPCVVGSCYSKENGRGSN